MTPRRVSGSPATATAAWQAHRYIETLPGGRAASHPEGQRATAIVDNTPEVTVPAGHLFVMGDNRDNLGRQPRSGWRTAASACCPSPDLIGRVESVVASWDLTMKDQPVWTWPSGLRFSRFFTAVR